MLSPSRAQIRRLSGSRSSQHEKTTGDEIHSSFSAPREPNRIISRLIDEMAEYLAFLGQPKVEVKLQLQVKPKPKPKVGPPVPLVGAAHLSPEQQQQQRQRQPLARW